MKKILLLAAFSTALLASCNNKEGHNNNSDEAKEAASAAGTAAFDVDSSQSVINWEGSKPTGKHTGIIKLSGGKLNVKDGQLVAGEFTLDMNSIVVTDLAAGDGKEDLEIHLKGTGKPEADDHFFNVKKYPTGKFVITKVTPLAGDNTATHNIEGNLTLKDITKNITLKAILRNEGEMFLAISPAITINRTDWNIKYASKSFMPNLGDKFVNDEMSIQINLTALKAKEM